MKLFKRRTAADETGWQLKQRAAAPSRYYGDGGTVHSTNYLHVETYRGTVTAVWFRCQMLPFRQVEVDGYHAAQTESVSLSELPAITGIELRDL